MKFERFCEENDSIMREFASTLNKIERERQSAKNARIELSFETNRQNVINHFGEETEYVESRIDEAEVLALEEYMEYDLSYIIEDLGGDTDNIEWRFDDQYGTMYLFPMFKQRYVEELIGSKSHIFDEAYSRDMIVMTYMVGDDSITVLDYEDGRNHSGDIEFEPSENVYRGRLHLEKDPYKEDDKMWDAELDGTRDDVENIMYYLKPVEDAIDDVNRVFEDTCGKICIDISDLVIEHLEKLL